MGFDHLAGCLQFTFAQRSSTWLDQFVHLRVDVSPQPLSPVGRRRAFGCSAERSLCHLSTWSLEEFAQVFFDPPFICFLFQILCFAHFQVVLHVGYDRQGGNHRRGAIQTRLHSVLRSRPTEINGLKNEKKCCWSLLVSARCSFKPTFCYTLTTIVTFVWYILITKMLIICIVYFTIMLMMCFKTHKKNKSHYIYKYIAVVSLLNVTFSLYFQSVFKQKINIILSIDRNRSSVLWVCFELSINLPFNAWSLLSI